MLQYRLCTHVDIDRWSVIGSYYRFEIVAISRTQQTVIRETMHVLVLSTLQVLNCPATSINTKGMHICCYEQASARTFLIPDVSLMHVADMLISGGPGLNM